MKNQSIADGGTPTVDTEALGSWVAETAAEKGVSERELLDEILSSYWVLEELSDVIVDPDGDGPPREGRPPGRASESQTPRTVSHSIQTGSTRPTTTRRWSFRASSRNLRSSGR